MSSDPVYVRWENRQPPHAKFYEVEIELSLFFPKQLVRRWGRLGQRPRCLHQVVLDHAQLTRQVDAIHRRRHRHGYDQVDAVYSTVGGQQAA